MTELVEGEYPDEICNRLVGYRRCLGTLVRDIELDGCSCHISAPCSYCHCEVQCTDCGYHSREDSLQDGNNVNTSLYYDSWYKELSEKRELLLRNIADKSYEFDAVRYYTEGHSNSSMKKIGGFPTGMSRDDLVRELNGSFGGRFERLSSNRFTFIAYTD